ncbi:ion transporter [Acuticoccus kandeliae]|uniref:ion transporter n=1 Tax=Acuticoccus kandeliae TaxID=2073160 RepID=UPI000D3E5B45|nr:ion transporter [Acuticoccus kandeliae]
MLTRHRILALLDGHDPVHGRAVAFAIQGLIIVSVISIAVESLPSIPPGFRRILRIEEWIVVTIFAVEYGLRIYASPRPLRYVFSFFGIIDLLAIAPTLLTMGLDMRSLRALRIVRVLRLLKLMRYVRAFERLGRAFRRIAAELVVFAAVALIVLYLCATGIYFFEHEAQPEAFASIPHAMWWAVVTLTTVGYGDVYPITAGGRIFTGFILMMALGIIAVPTGLIATALSNEHPTREAQEREKDDTVT